MSRLTRYEDNLAVIDELCKHTAYSNIQAVIDKLAHYEDLEETRRLITLPCKDGDTVYRICPKCNDRHDGSCEHCAWRGALSMSGCNTYGLWSNGEYPPEKCTIVPYKVSWNYIPDLLEKFGKTVFSTKAEAERKLAEIQKGE